MLWGQVRQRNAAHLSDQVISAGPTPDKGIAAA
jgi:hypothetical protein